MGRIKIGGGGSLFFLLDGDGGLEREGRGQEQVGYYREFMYKICVYIIYIYIDIFSIFGCPLFLLGAL